MKEWRSFRDDRRSVSVTVNYIMALGISAILVTGLLIAGGSFVEDQRESVIEGELAVIGHHIAGNVEQVDRYVRASGDDELEAAYVNQSFQSSVTGATYTVEFAADSVVLRTARPQVEVAINTTVATELDTDSSAIGGSVSVYYDGEDNGEDGKLVIDND